MKYMMLINLGPAARDWKSLPEDEQQAIAAGWQAINTTPGVNRLGRTGEAREAYRQALNRVHDDAERRLFERRLGAIGGPDAVHGRTGSPQADPHPGG